MANRSAHRLWVPALQLLGYGALALILTWPLALHLGSAVPGYPNVDALDTIMLRGLVAELFTHPWDMPDTDGVYFPQGFPLMFLVPNVVDHLIGAPLARLLPFPLSDNLYWLMVLTLNGLAGHHLGRQLGGSHAAGALAGVAFAASEPILREANLWHAPQTMAFWAPLYLAALLRLLGTDGRWRDGLMAGLWMGLAGLTYWYLGLFLAVGSVPVVVWGLWRERGGLRRLGLAVVVAIGLALPGLLPYTSNWDKIPLTGEQSAPPPINMRPALDVVPERYQFIVEHSGDPLFFLQSTPLDRSNQVRFVVIGAAALVLWRRRREPGPEVALAAAAAIAGVMVMGPYLKWGEDPLGLISLPFKWLGELHPFLARLTWPERWGVLIALAMAGLISRAPRPGWIAGALLLETLLLSGNAPLQHRDLSRLEPWRAVQASQGAVLELPLSRGGLQAPLVGLHARYHGHKLVNPMLLPPGQQAPLEWKRWQDEQALVVYLNDFESGGYPADPGPEAVVQLRDAGVGALVLDARPGSMITPGRVVRYINHLGKHLGPPDDYGAVLVWWLAPPLDAPPVMEDGAAWRKAAQRELEALDVPDLDTLIEPSWDARGHQSF